MLNQFSRTQLLLGQDGMERLYNARVAVFGIGGVGGYTVEALVRSGVGTLDLIDDDWVCLTNMNRQIFATRKTVGQYKVDVAEERIKEINPNAVVHTYKTFYAPQTADQFDFTQYDYIVDAIDTVTGKLELIEQAQRAGTPIISSMGAGNKMDASAFEVTDGIAELLGAAPEEIIYTSGASESNNLALKGIVQASRHVGKHIISTALEHSSVGGALSALQQQGCEVDLVDIRRDGTIDLEHLRELLRKDTVLVAICAVDSELGTVQPIQEIADILRDYPNCRLHVDATQAVGKTKLVLSGVDTMSIAPHKFYGLNGSGLLVKKKDLVIEPQIHGGGSTTPYRSGTPALGMAMSIEKALRLAIENQNERIAHVAALNRLLRAELAKYPKVRFNSPENAVPHILNLSVNGVKGTAFQQELGKNDVCVSVKSACSVEGTPSKAVYAVSRDRKNALSSWRISLSHLTTEAEIAEFLQIFDRCYRELAQ